MARIHEGGLDARGLRVGVVVSRFNESVSRRLLEGALDCLRRHGASEEDVVVVWVPGAFEIPVAAMRLARSGEVDALVCLGAVVRGETPHFEHVAAHASSGIGRVALDTGIPVANGVLTTDDSAQAHERAGGKAGNKGFEAAAAAVEMANLMASLPKERGEL